MAYDDLPEIMAIEWASFTAPWYPEMFVAEMEGPVSFSSVAEVEGRVVGYATYRVILDEAHLMNIAIAPDHQRKGLGRRLMDEVIAHCASKGAAYMFLEVRRSNVEAQALYLGMGFSFLDVRKAYYTDNREDAIILKLDFPGAAK
jgi:[ribosomal protein S18]-alanine N-acetyltransferase